ncbi:MAG: hypothetical protein AB7F59_12105 [Bdellovibrionales bacterium]
MKAVTEFANYILTKAVSTKAALAAEGKTPEEIQASLGETFKYEGEKLIYFVNAIDVAGNNAENLKRVLVMKPGEGETAGGKAVKVDELYYVPEFIVLASAKPKEASDGKGKRGGGKRGPKESPWGLSPEEEAAKKAARKANTANKGAAPAKQDG